MSVFNLSRKVLLLSSLLLVSSFYQSVFAEEAMTVAASNFLNALSGEHRAQATFVMDSEERSRWHFIPNEIFEREGISLKLLNSQQRQLAHNLLDAGLSQGGHLTVMAIIELEKVLRALEPNGMFIRDHEDYRVSVFGEPDPFGTWAWRFEGHHLSLHFTVVDGDVTVSAPTFLGSNPAQVRSGAQSEQQRGQRVLASREDGARELMKSLNTGQQLQAMIGSEAPRDILSGNDYPLLPFADEGILFSDMTDNQRAQLSELIQVYTANMNDSIAASRWQKIRDEGMDNIRFAWMGSTEIGMPHYYRVQGESFLIEYDNVQNEANHVHSVWRDFDDDFGRDLLREHYESNAHWKAQ